MAYQSRKKGYKSRREKFQIVSRNTKVTLLFAGMALVVYIVMIRHDIWGWLKTFMY